MRQNLGGHSDADAFGALGKKQRETHRKLGRLLVTPVVAAHPMGNLRVENHFLGELAEPCLDVTRRGIGISREDITPVSLAIHGESLLSELNQCSKNGGISMGMVLHSLSDYVCHLGVCTVIHPVHGM